jgi:hypothetical protein
MFAMNSVGAMAHCLEEMHVSSSSSNFSKPILELHKTSENSTHHSPKSHLNNHSKKKADSSVSICAGPSLALVMQFKVNLPLTLTEAPFAEIAWALLGLSVAPPSEPPRA